MDKAAVVVPSKTEIREPTLSWVKLPWMVGAPEKASVDSLKTEPEPAVTEISEPRLILPSKRERLPSATSSVPPLNVPVPPAAETSTF